MEDNFFITTATVLLKDLNGNVIAQGKITKSSGSNILYKDGEPCEHVGCANHITHPCEYCGRIGARGDVMGYQFWK
jgi:hypothetical protein